MGYVSQINGEVNQGAHMDIVEMVNCFGRVS